MGQTNEALERAEEETIKEITQMVKDYFQNHQKAVTKKELTINKIEDLLLEAKIETERIMKRALKEAVKATEMELIEKKNSAQDVKAN